MKLITKILKVPEDWLAAIDRARGKQSFSEFVRACVREKIRGKLSANPTHGQRTDLEKRK